MSPARTARPPRRRQVAVVWAAVVGMVGFAAAVMGMINDGWSVLDRVRNEAPESGQAASATPSAMAPSVTASSVSAVAGGEAGTCLYRGTAVDCADPHDAESIGPAANCTPTRLVSHLGGAPSIDVAAPDVRVAVTAVGGRSVCALTRAEAWTGEAKGALTDSRSAGWRWCADTKKTQATVSCTQPHDAEIVALSDSAPDCIDAARTYTGTTWADLEADLTVRAFRRDSRHGCLLETRAVARLTDTVRDLGSRALPLA